MKSIEILKDSIGQEYLGIKYSEYELNNYINSWKELFISDKDKNLLLDMIANRFNRDGNEYHITIFNVMEFEKMKKTFCVPKLDNILSTIIYDINIEGIGKGIKNDNQTYFLIVNSKIINDIRENYGMNPNYLHITLGFDKKDVHGVDKGISSLILKL